MHRRRFAIYLLAAYVVVELFLGFGEVTCYPETTNCQGYSVVYSFEVVAIPAALILAVHFVTTRILLGDSGIRENRISGYHLFQCSILASGPRKAGLKLVPFA